jgi:hypothetical protein
MHVLCDKDPSTPLNTALSSRPENVNGNAMALTHSFQDFTSSAKCMNFKRRIVQTVVTSYAKIHKLLCEEIKKCALANGLHRLNIWSYMLR